MKKFEFIYPSFSFSKHKGYPTSLHIHEIEKFGIIELHRKTFKPINKLKNNNNLENNNFLLSKYKKIIFSNKMLKKISNEIPKTNQ